MDISVYEVKDLQMQLVENRIKYGSAIRMLYRSCSRYTIKALEAIQPTIHPDLETLIDIPNIVFDDIDYNKECKYKTDLKAAVEQQVKIITILNKQRNCPIAQKMKEL